MGEISIIEILLFLFSYLVGSISFSYIIGKKIAGIDIRNHGSKNAGATNTLRVLGKGPAILVLLLDLLKGSIAVMIAMIFSDSAFVYMLAGLFAIVGHNWPVFFGFKGGKGVATSIGVIIALTPIPFLITAIFGLIILYMFRYVSLASIIASTIYPITIFVMDAPQVYLIGAFAIMALTYIRHRANIRRLLNGTENKLGTKKPRETEIQKSSGEE